MSLFGKMMAILNVLAAGAFLFLAAKDYAVRQQWAYAVFKHKLALNGLPVDDDETDDDNQKIAPNIDDELAQSTSGDAQVKTLEQFLDLRKDEIDALLSNASAQKREAAAYMDLLAPLAQTELERQQIVEGKVALAQLKDMYKAHYDAVAKQGDREARRQAIARLLVAWSDVLPSAAERDRRNKERGLRADKRRDPAVDAELQRLARVLGPRQLSGALSAQADRIERWASEVENTRNLNRTQFTFMHADLVNSLLPWHAAVADQEMFRTWKKQQADEQRKLADAQVKAVSDLTGQLDTAKQETAKMLARLTRQQDELHDVRVKLRDANVINQMKEALIRKLEGLPR